MVGLVVIALTPLAAQGKGSTVPSGLGVPSTWRTVDGALVDFQNRGRA